MHLPITHPPPRQTQSTPPQYSPLYRTHSVPTLRWPNPSPGGSDFGFWLQSAPPRASPDRTSPPRQTQSTPPQYSPLYRTLSPPALRWPNPSPGSSGFGFWLQSVPPRASPDRTSPPRQTQSTPPQYGPLYRTRSPPALRWPNPSSGSSDLVFGPQPPLPPRVGERAAPPTSPPHPRHSTTFPHRLPLPFHTAHSKSSHRAQFRGFWPLAPSPASYLRTRSPTTTTTSSTSRHRLPHRPPPPFHTAHPKSSHRARFRGFWPLAPSPTSHLRTRSLTTTTTTSSTSRHHLPPPPSTAISHGVPKIEPWRSVLWLLAPRQFDFNISLDLP